MRLINNILTICCIALITFSSKGVEAQSLPKNDSILAVNILDYLPPLPVIIDSALSNDAQVSYFEQLLESAEYDVSIEKKAWANDLTLQGGYAWTQGNQVLIQGVISGNGSDVNEGYNYGATLSIPLSSWYGRSDRIARAEAMRGSQQAKINEAAFVVREIVIETYNELLLLQRLLEITSEARQTADLIADMADEKFRDGELTLEELSAVTNAKSQAASEYEQNRTAFSNAYSKLERLAGFSFSKMQ